VIYPAPRFPSHGHQQDSDRPGRGRRRLARLHGVHRGGGLRPRRLQERGQGVQPLHRPQRFRVRRGVRPGRGDDNSGRRRAEVRRGADILQVQRSMDGRRRKARPGAVTGLRAGGLLPGGRPQDLRRGEGPVQPVLHPHNHSIRRRGILPMPDPSWPGRRAGIPSIPPIAEP